MDGLTLLIIISAALVDSINPGVFGFLVLLLGYTMEMSGNRKRMLITGSWFVLVAYLTYVGIGFGVLNFLETIPQGFFGAFYWLAAIWVILAGLASVKSYFWRRNGASLQMFPGEKERIKIYINKLRLIQKKYPERIFFAAGILGVLVVIVEFMRAGVLYFAALNLLQHGDPATELLYLLLYNLVVVMPLFAIVGVAYLGRSLDSLNQWKKKYRGVTRLGMGLFLIAFGAYMVYFIGII